MSTTNNTVPRKTLASQIDRLDNILDGLSDGLNEAVSSAIQGIVGQAVREAVKEAVQGVVLQVLSNPLILERLRQILSPPTPTTPVTTNPPLAREPGEKEPGAWQQRLGRTRHWLGERWSWFRGVCGHGWQQCCVVGNALWQFLLVLWFFRGSTLLLLSVGMAFGGVSYWVGPTFSAVLAGAGGIALTVLAIAGLTMRRMLLLSQATES